MNLFILNGLIFRERDGWSHKYARRQWYLTDNKDLKYHYLSDFDAEMLHMINSVSKFQTTKIQKIWDNDSDQILAYMRGDLFFVFNFNPSKSFTGYGFLAPPGEYKVILNTDAVKFGGNGLTDIAFRT
jgi:1,4-alpha-glucan branching enzyme